MERTRVVHDVILHNEEGANGSCWGWTKGLEILQPNPYIRVVVVTDPALP